jgi:hypothetical protein
MKKLFFSLAFFLFIHCIPIRRLIGISLRSTLLIAIFISTFNIVCTRDCLSQWIHQSGITNNNITQAEMYTFSSKNISYNGWYFSPNLTNEKIRFFFYNPIDSIKSNEQDTNITKSINPADSIKNNDSIITKSINPADSINKFLDTSITKINKPVLIKDSIKNKEPDSNITKDIKTIIKRDTVKILVKTPPALNSITFQPIGLFLLFTNFEYDRAIIRNLSVGAKITFTTFLLSSVLEKTQKKEKDRTPIKTLSSFGIGGHLRYFPGNRAIEGFFLGGAVEGLTIKYDETKENKSYDSLMNQTTVTNTINHKKATLTRIEFEIGARTVVSSGTGGFTIQWSLGAGVGYWNDGKKNGVIPLGSMGFGIGYAF